MSMTRAQLSAYDRALKRVRVMCERWTEAQVREVLADTLDEPVEVIRERLKAVVRQATVTFGNAGSALAARVYRMQTGAATASIHQLDAKTEEVIDATVRNIVGDLLDEGYGGGL